MTIDKKVDHKKIWLTSLEGMSIGFFASLIVGFFFSIFVLINNNLSDLVEGGVIEDNPFLNIRSILTYTVCLFVGLAIALKANLSLLQVIAVAITAIIVGQSQFVPDFSQSTIGDAFSRVRGLGISFPGSAGDVFAAWISGVIWLYIFNIFKWQTHFDLFILPFLGVVLGLGQMWFVTYLTTSIVGLLGFLLSFANGNSRLLTILLAPVIGVVFGVTLSLPVSSAALALMLSLRGDVASAAMAGTSAQMVSWGAITWLGNKNKSETLAVTIGTSMFQLKNFVKKPSLFVIPIIASACSALLAVIFMPGMFERSDGIVAGMGTAALYGPIFTLIFNQFSLLSIMHVIFAQILFPLVLAIILGLIFYRKKWIKSEDVLIWATAKNTQPNILAKQLR